MNKCTYLALSCFCLAGLLMVVIVQFFISGGVGGALEYRNVSDSLILC